MIRVSPLRGGAGMRVSAGLLFFIIAWCACAAAQAGNDPEEFSAMDRSEVAVTDPVQIERRRVREGWQGQVDPRTGQALQVMPPDMRDSLEGRVRAQGSSAAGYKALKEIERAQMRNIEVLRKQTLERKSERN